MSRSDKRPAYSSTARVSTANPVASCVTTVGFVMSTAEKAQVGRLQHTAFRTDSQHETTLRNGHVRRYFSVYRILL